MRIMTAHTSETDNVEAAVSDILDQLTRQLDPLNPPGRFDPDSLGPHAAGVMFYYEEFAEAGIARGICGRLPFPVIGGTTSNSAVPGSREDITLTLTVFSGDDCGFSAALGGPMDCDSSYIALEKLYRTVMDGRPAGMGERPSFFLIITPQQRDITGDDYLAALTSLSGGVPLFGASAFTHQPDFRNIKTFFNGAEYDDVPVLLAVWSKAEPRFFLSTIPDEQILSRRGMITDSYRNRIRRINGIPVFEYMESLGLAKEGKLAGIASFPLVLHLPGGSRLVRTIYGAEDGELICSGGTPANMPIEISFCDREFVVDSARRTAEECRRALAERREPTAGALVISCAARRWTLGADVYAEIRAIDEGLEGMPWHFAYSRGEFCPVLHRGTLINQFFNYSLCICVL